MQETEAVKIEEAEARREEDIRRQAKWATWDELSNDDLRFLFDRLDAARQERDAYKKAKAENDSKLADALELIHSEDGYIASQHSLMKDLETERKKLSLALEAHQLIVDTKGMGVIKDPLRISTGVLKQIGEL